MAKLLLRRQSLVGLALAFLLFMAWFASTRWYAPAQLMVKGFAPQGRGIVEVSWDNGAGFNDYEKRRFLLDTSAPAETGLHTMVIRSTGQRHGASLSADIICSSIAVDGKDMDLFSFATGGERIEQRRAVRLYARGQEIAVTVKAEESIAIKLDSDNQSGVVELEVNGRTISHDLYTPVVGLSRTYRYWVVRPDGGFTVRMELPRYKIKTLLVTNGHPTLPLAVESIRVLDDRGSHPLYAGESTGLAQMGFRGVSKIQMRFFHSWAHLTLQIVFAALTVWVMSGCWRVFRSSQKSGGLLARHRLVFWLLWGGIAGMFSLWLMAFWPGVMSVDSMKIWRAALLPGVYLNDHPLLNVIFYRYLVGLWNNVAVVPLAHIVALSGAMAYFLYRLHRRGLPLWLTAVFAGMAATSIPVGLYNVTLWKDVPFALLIVFWGFTLVELHLQKREGKLHSTWEGILALVLSLLALAFTRHNGLIYVAVVPIYAIVLGLVPRRLVVIAFCMGGAIVALFLLTFASGIGVPGGDYLFSQGAFFLNSLWQRSFADMAVLVWENYWGMLDINQKKTSWDLWHYFLGDRTAYDFIIHAGWSDVFGYLSAERLLPRLNEAAMAVYHLSCQAPWVYLSWNPVHVLVLLPAAVMCAKKLPLSGIFASFLLVQVLALLLIDVMNWRYYYFVVLGGYVLLPLLALDMLRAVQTRGLEVEG